MNFSLEISPTTDLDTVPPVNDVYITMLPGGDYKETAQQAVELVKKGYNPVPHFPARSMHDEKQLKDYVLRCKDGGVKQALIIGGGREPLKESSNDLNVQTIFQTRKHNYYLICICDLFKLSNVSNSSNMLELLELKISKYLRILSFIVDLLIRLGLVGTVIGFILMLQSVTLIENFDINLMQDLMKNMSAGMMVALYTTLTGLTSAMILMLQNKYLELLLIDLYSLVSERLRAKNEI